MPQYCFLNGKIIPQNKAFLSVTDLGILRGYGVFDFIRTYNGKPFLFKEHLNRFKRSAKLINIKIPITEKEIVKNINLLLKKNKHKNSNIKIVLTGGILDANSPTLYILVEKLKELPTSIYQKGIKLVTCEHQREIPEAKILNYITAFKLQSWQKREDAFEILYTYKGKYLEATTSNFFIFIGNKLITPKKNILIGTTRNLVLGLAKNKFPIVERDIRIGFLRPETPCIGLA